MTFPHLVFFSKAAVLISVHPLHVSSKCSGWDWEAGGGAWRKEGGRGERDEEERGIEKKEGRGRQGRREWRERKGRCVCIR